MNNLQLITLSDDYREQYLRFIEESTDDLIKTGFNFGLMTSEGETFEEYVEKKKNRSMGIDLSPGRVPDTTYFVLNNGNNEICGAVFIRHYLNENLLWRGGHIGYYVGPKHRNNGVAKIALKLALEVCKKLCINEVLVTCSKDNIASAKVIVANGGVLENEPIEDNGEVFQRYWIRIV